MSGIPYLGSKISLISKSEIRYEGILVDVNAAESTITFEQVRFFGTEGRRPADEIAPMDRVFDCVVFRSADIKDLQVYETPKETEKAKEPEFPDPAVVSFASAGSSSGNNVPSGFQYQSKSTPSIASTSVAAVNEEVKMPKANNYASAVSSQPQQAQQQQYHQNKSFNTRNPRSYNNTQNDHQHHHNQQQQRSRGIVVPKSEFDFSQSNAKFSKDEITAAIPAEIEEATAVPSYNKNLSFFDDISCQTNSEGSRVMDRNRNERNLNMETFGQAAPPRRYGHRGGRGRGGYRGGYSNNSNNSNYHNNTNSQSRSTNNDQN